MTNEINSDPTGKYQVISKKSNPEVKKGRRGSSHRLAKCVGVLVAGGLLAGLGAKEFVYDPRQEALAKAEQTQADDYANAKVGNRLLKTTGSAMFISAPAKIRQNPGTFTGFPFFKPDNVTIELQEGQELFIADGIARDYGFKWTEFRLRDETRDPKPNSASEFANGMMAVRHEELAAQGLVTVCKLPGRGEHSAYIDPKWVLRGTDSDTEVAIGTVLDMHQAATIKGAYGKACEVLK